MSIDILTNDMNIFKLDASEKEYYQELTENDIIEIALINTSWLHNKYVQNIVRKRNRKHSKSYKFKFGYYFL